MKKALPVIVFALTILSLNLSAQTLCTPPTQKAHLDINNVDATLLNGGDMWWDLVMNSGYEVPKGSGIHSAFATGLWIGGIDPGGQLHMAAATYRQRGNDFFPGPLDGSGNVSASTCLNFDRMWKVNKTTIDSFKNGFFSSTPASIRDWPAKGNPNLSFLPSQDLAPFVDTNGDGKYNPADWEFPDIKGDQAIWWVFNDKGNAHTETSWLPMGIEVQVMAFAYSSTTRCLNNATFYQYTVIYKGATALDSTFIGIWSDHDLGCYVDDFIGCDSTRNLGFAYNADNFDGKGCADQYDSLPPVFGIDFLGSKGFPVGESFRMSRYGTYYNDFKDTGNPEDYAHYYNYLTGTWKDNSRWTYGGNGFHGSSPTNYMYTGQPSDPTKWSLCAMGSVPNDIRAIQSSGPHHLKPGDRRTFYLGAVWYQLPAGNYKCADITDFLLEDDCIQAQFNADFPVGIKEVDSQDGLSVFPNPSSDFITFQLHSGLIDEVRIYDVLGREMTAFTKVNRSKLTIPGDNLAPGVYIHKVKDTGGKEYTGKLIFE